ncbi:MAG: hypothetical protein ACLQNE_28125, partial [Thermoguttaceae bacterium]
GLLSLVASTTNVRGVRIFHKRDWVDWLRRETQISGTVRDQALHPVELNDCLSQSRQTVIAFAKRSPGALVVV